MCKWNLLRLAEALDPFVKLEQSSSLVESKYDEFFKEMYYFKMAQKLGFAKKGDDMDETEVTDDQIKCIDDLMQVMKICMSDFTNTFRALSDFTS